MNRNEVLNSLAKQGYPFELRVGQTLRQAGWDVRHAEWYTDPQTGKLRELDLIADIDAANHEVGFAIFVELAVECKHSPDKPWVVFTTPQTLRADWVRCMFSADELSRGVLTRAAMSHVPFPSLIQFADRIGHGIVKAFRDGKHREDNLGDPTSPFAALQSVTSAATAVAGQHTSGVLEKTSNVLPITIPIIVLGGNLYEFFIDAEGNETLEEIEFAQVVVGRPDSDEVYVTVMTHEYLKANAKRLADETREFCRQLVPNYASITQSLRETELNTGPGMLFLNR